jgi:hypothetical protein
MLISTPCNQILTLPGFPFLAEATSEAARLPRWPGRPHRIWNKKIWIKTHNKSWRNIATLRYIYLSFTYLINIWLTFNSANDQKIALRNIMRILPLSQNNFKEVPESEVYYVICDLFLASLLFSCFPRTIKIDSRIFS